MRWTPLVRSGPGAALMLSLLCLVAAACGADDDRQDLTDISGFPEDGSPPAAGLPSTRTAMGISAAGGAAPPGPACPEAGSPQASGAVTIAWSSPDQDELAAVGLETMVLDEPSLIVEAYINEVNANGGINGNCFEPVAYAWDLADPDASFRQICTDLPERRPLLLLSLWMNDTTLRCATLDAQVPTLGIFTSLPASSLESSEGRLFLDDGSVGHLLSNSLNVAARADVLTGDDRIGLLVTDGASAAAQIKTALAAVESLDLELVSVANVPSEFGTVGVSVAERQVRLLESGLTDSETEAAVRRLSRLSPEKAEVLRQMEEYFLDTVEHLRRAGVTTVVSSSTSADVRRLMRAAERLDWFPQWVINDSQPAVLTLTGAPEEQVRRLVQISSRRAAGDPIPDSDRACVSLRNTSAEAPPFSHRTHTDAWNLITATCDSLDLVFAAMTRVAWPLTREALIDALALTDYETAHGSRISFAPDDHNGSDRFRVLRADPDCVLDEWGCMRAESDWFGPDDALLA